MADNIEDKGKKRICPDCGEKFEKNEGSITINLPKHIREKIPEDFAEDLVQKIFPNVWDDGKGDLKQMSRREACEEMFYAGAVLALGNFLGVDGDSLISKDENSEENLWEEGGYVKKIKPEEMEDKMRTFSMGHDEEMNFNCKDCNAKISAHNKDWHEELCDSCFNKKYNDGEMHINYGE